MPFATLDAEAIASTLHGGANNTNRTQTRHRIKLIKCKQLCPDRQINTEVDVSMGDRRGLEFA